MPAGRRDAMLGAALAVVLAGCGSAPREELPPAAEPARSPPLMATPAGRVVPVGRTRTAVRPDGVAVADDGRRIAVVSARERVLEVYDARTLRRIGRVPAGVGPTRVVSDRGNLLYVADTAGDALLVFHLRPRLELTRRLYLAGAPYGLAIDPRRRRIWVTLTRVNRLVELVGGARPHFRREHAAVRQPDTVAVDERTGRVHVTGRVDGVLQVLDPRSR